jgi:exosortase
MQSAPEQSPPARTAASEILSERWRLAVLERTQLVQLAFMAVIIGLLYVLFHLLGNTVEHNVGGRSAFTWMVSRWSDSISYGGADYSHGWLIPFVSLGIVWTKRRELITVPRGLCQWGLAVIVAALLIHWLGAKIQQTRLSLAALILLLWGVPLYFFGWQVAKFLIFPCAYLIFCIPLTFLDTLSFPLRIFATAFSTHTANLLGIGVYSAGSRIMSDASGGFSFDVADPCSGLRSLLAMTALTAVYAYATQKTQLKKWVLFLASIPLALAGNSARILSIIIVSAAFGEKAALKVYHDWSGYIMFIVAVGLMVGTGVLMNTDYRQVWRRFKGWLTAREPTVT